MRRAFFIGASLAVHGAVLAAGFGWWPRGSEPAVVVEDPQPLLAGDTFDIALSQAPSVGGGVVATETATATATATATVPTSTSTSTSTATSRTSTSTSTSTRTGTGTGMSTSGSDGLTYGAVGDRSAVEVAVAFTRTFPQAASADLLWEGAAFGEAGSAELTFEIAADGTLSSWRISGGAPSAALKSAIDRTMALVNGRTFVGTAPVTRIRVAAQVSPDQVHDGLHGDVFAVGGSYTGGVGSAFFALAVGRRVDLTVKALP